MQKQRREFFRAATVALFIVGGVVMGTGAAGRPAFADVKIVSEQSLTGMEDWGVQGIDVKITRYFKGNMMREETEGENLVHIYDSKNDKYYTIDRNSQTYAVQTLDEVMSDAEGSLAQLSVVGNATVSEGGSTQKIAGKNAKNYITAARLIIKSDRSGTKVVDVKMQSEQWTTSTVALPSANPRLIQAAYLVGTNAQKLFKPYYDKVTEIKGLPLSFEHILTFQTAPGILMNGAHQGTMEAHGDVKSVSTATLPAYLFVVPKTYRLVPRIAPRVGGS